MFSDELTTFLQELRTLGVKPSIVEEFERVSNLYLSTAERIGLGKIRTFPSGTGKLDSTRLMMYENFLLAHLTLLTQAATGTMPNYSHLMG
jgi:hypothetical protein